MTETSEIIDLKITELKEEIEKGNLECENSGSLKYLGIYNKILLISTILSFIALTYILFTMSNGAESIALQASIMLAYLGISIIPRIFFYRVTRKTQRIRKLTLRLIGFEWLKTRAPDQQENILKIMKNRGLI